MQDFQVILHRSDMRFSLARRANEQFAVVVEGNPLRQVESPRRRNKWHLILAPACLTRDLLNDSVRRLGDSRLELGFVGNRYGWDLAFMLCPIDNRPSRGEHVVDKV